MERWPNLQDQGMLQMPPTPPYCLQRRAALCVSRRFNKTFSAPANAASQHTSSSAFWATTCREPERRHRFCTCLANNGGSAGHGIVEMLPDSLQRVKVGLLAKFHACSICSVQPYRPYLSLSCIQKLPERGSTSPALPARKIAFGSRRPQKRSAKVGSSAK